MGNLRIYPWEAVGVGMVFGKLTVLAPHARKGTNRCWLCRCECGRLKIAYDLSLRDSLTYSCGCTQRKKKSVLCSITQDAKA